MGKNCDVCKTLFTGRKDRRWCSVPCRMELKRRYDRDRYPEISDAVVKRACDWQKANRHRKRAYDISYRQIEERKIKKAASAKLARLLDPEQDRLRAPRRRARRLGNGMFRITLRDLKRLTAHYDAKCAYCRDSFTDDNPLEWDHVIPIARGGRHSIGNLVPACRTCNRNKQIKLITEWRAGRIVCVRDYALTA